MFTRAQLHRRRSHLARAWDLHVPAICDRRPTSATCAGVHTTGGYLTGVTTTMAMVFDLDADRDTFWCTADVGWITGHSYIVYGPLANGCTSVMFEGAPDYPDKDIWWEIVERYQVTIFYTAPTSIPAVW
jgi:acyl-coenzyme A synthetase/AMP-(fatty) acid ligase